MTALQKYTFSMNDVANKCTRTKKIKDSSHFLAETATLCVQCETFLQISHYHPKTDKHCDMVIRKKKNPQIRMSAHLKKKKKGQAQLNS